MKKVFLLTTFILGIIFVFGCKRHDDVEPTDDNELITTVELIFTDANKKSVSYTWQDKDGDPKTNPDIFDKITLDRNMDYTLDLKLSDVSKSPVVDITNQILLENDVHLFIFKVSPSSLLTINATDFDKNGLKVGLKSKAKTQLLAGQGKFNLILKHQPPINGKAVKTGDENGGSTDVDIPFDLIIK